MESTQLRAMQETPEAVWATYEKAWEATRKRIEKEIATGDALPSILARMGRLKLDHHMVSYWREDPRVHRIGRQVLQAHGVDDAPFRNPYFPAVVDGRYTVNSGFSSIRYLYNNVLPETTAVVEFGSGWSANLFQLSVLAGAGRLKTLKLYGAEYTAAGRACGELLAAHEPDLDYTAVPFDWTAPDLSFLDEVKGSKHVLVYSHHSIEQVPEVSADFYRQLSEVADSVACIHLEPVGWQRDAGLLSRRKADDTGYFDAMSASMGLSHKDVRLPASSPGESLLSVETQVRTSAWWSWLRGYNHNLLELVDTLVTEERASLRQVMFDVDSLLNPLNPSTLINLELGRRYPR